MILFCFAYLSVAAEVPQKIKASLHQTARIACGNLLKLPGPIMIGPDTTESMGCQVTRWLGRGSDPRMLCFRTFCTELLSNGVFYVLGLSGIFILHDSVFEGTSFDDECDLFVAVESSPFLGSKFSELEHHR